MPNVMHGFLIYPSIHFCLTCFGLSFSPSSEAGVNSGSGSSLLVWGRAEAYRRIWWETLRKRELLEATGVGGRIILRWIFIKWDVRAWTGSI
jgi:hypothetical protein